MKPAIKRPCDVLKELWSRSGLRGTEIARRAGYTVSSGFYNLANPKKQGARPIPHESIRRLIPVLRGLGKPPITIDELLAISNAAVSAGPALLQSLAEASRRSASEVDLARETGGDLLPVRLRAERGVFVDPSGPARVHGVSRVGRSPEHGAASQSVVVIYDDHAAPVYPRGSQLHIVDAGGLAGVSLEGRRVVVYTADSRGLAEVLVCRVTRVGPDGAPELLALSGESVAGRVAGVVIGAYIRE